MKRKKSKSPSYNIDDAILLSILALILLAFSFYISHSSIRSATTQTSVLGSKSNKPSTKGNNSNALIQLDKELLRNQPGMNAETYRQNAKGVAKKLKTVAVSESQVGNTEASQEISEVADDTEETATETADAITAVESKPKWQVLLFGSDYKNLGQLRSSLAHNTNSIRKLTGTVDDIDNITSGSEVQAQLEALLLERERLVGIIEENESQFSLLGWVSKLLAGYKETPTDTDEDIIDTGTEPENTTPTPTPTPTTTPTLIDTGTQPAL